MQWADLKYIKSKEIIPKSDNFKVINHLKIFCCVSVQKSNARDAVKEFEEMRTIV